MPSISQSGMETEFGQNRIQYHDDFDDWYQYETQNFVTYWYGKARNIGQLTISLAEYDFTTIENILEHKLNDKIEIICYTDISDLKQSNIGVTDLVIGQNERTLVSGNKIFVYFDGDHSHLRKQIREGIAEVYLNAMIYGGGLSGILQRNVKLKIPDWFKEGLIAYLGDEWNVRQDNSFRDLLQLTPGKKKFESIAKINPRLVGHAFWNYLTYEYGKSNVSNILYLTRINRNIKSSFLYILGIPFDQISDACIGYFRKNYAEDRKTLREYTGQQKLTAKNKKRIPINQVRVSPDGNHVAYSINNKGKYKVYVQKLNGKDKPLKIFAGGIKNNVQETDYSIPVFSWNPKGKDIALVTEKRDQWWLYQIDLSTGKSFKDKLGPEYQRIYAVDYIDDKSILLNASTDALSDLYMYLPVTRESRRISQDFYDDLDASYGTLMDQKGILFKSNRVLDSLKTLPVDSILPVAPFNLYFLPFEPDKIATSKKAIRLTENYYYDIDQPSISGKNQITFLYDENGVKQRKSITIDNTGTQISTSSSHLDHDFVTYHAADDKGIGVIHRGRKIDLVRDGVNTKDTIDWSPTSFRKLQIKTNKIPDILSSETFAVPPAPKTEPSEEKPVVLFQSEFPDFESKDDKKQSMHPDKREEKVSDPVQYDPVISRFNPVEIEAPEKFSFIRMIASRLKFKLHETVSTMDNSLLFGGLNSYAGQKMGFEYPPAGFLLKAKIKDLFEDYAIEGGVRIPTNFNGTEYFMIFDNNKRRIDKRFAIYRQTRYTTEELSAVFAQRYRNRTMIALAQFKYPFDTYQSFRLSGTLRFDRSVLLATAPSNLDHTPVTNQRLGIKGEYVYDNSTPIDINRFLGTRLKFYAEAVKKMQIQVVDDWKLDLSKGFMTVLGFDARQYIGLDRRTILALRGAGATSYGSEKILFFLGGVDNWLAPQYDDDTPIPGDANYAYYALGAHLRGFKQNIRNGASYLLFNSELRIPFLQYFSGKEIRSTFLRNLQVVGFLDAGTAWFGRTPFDQKSPLNTTTVSNPKVKIDLIYARDPLVVGFGTGLRLSLMGYQIRADYGWGIETREILKPRFYISLGNDF